MMHDRRRWCVSAVASAEELAALLTQRTWTLCSAFVVRGHESYLFLIERRTFMSDTFAPNARLNALILEFATGDILAQPDGELWADTINRINSGRIAEVTEETWFWFLECLPPKLQRGSWFAFAEGQEELKFFWCRQGRHYARQLTWEQSFQLCDATGLRKNYGCD